jgi:DNA-binding helix-hairpin-helix protein with protein kinase domain
MHNNPKKPRQQETLSVKQLDKLLDEIRHNVETRKQCEMHDCHNYVVLGAICDPCHEAYYQDVGGEDMDTSVGRALTKVQRDVDDFMWGRGLDDDD